MFTPIEIILIIGAGVFMSNAHMNILARRDGVTNPITYKVWFKVFSTSRSKWADILEDQLKYLHDSEGTDSWAFALDSTLVINRLMTRASKGVYGNVTIKGEPFEEYYLRHRY